MRDTGLLVYVRYVVDLQEASIESLYNQVFKQWPTVHSSFDYVSTWGEGQMSTVT